MISQLLPIPLFWDLMGFFMVGLIGWVITWPISRSLAWFASAAGTGVISAILLLAILFHFAGAAPVDPLDDLFYTLLFWLSLHLVSAIAFVRRICWQAEQKKAWLPEETTASQTSSFPTLALHS